jgi:diguanylate cyclase (GGDEF)-like protein
LFALLTLLVAWMAGERLIIVPLRKMARKITTFGRDELTAGAGSSAWDAEFVPLVKAFDAMAARLSARERELQSKNDHLAALASLDGLSGLANRRSFDARLELEWERAAACNEPLALLMIDVDRFKLFNDHYGHVEGDACLRRIGQALASIAQEPAFPARYGGEEFAVLLRNADRKHALAVAERLRRAVETLKIAHVRAPRGLMTLSIGVAAMQFTSLNIGATSAALVEAADAALYVAKRSGRNAVVCSPDSVPAPVSFAAAKLRFAKAL